MATIISRTLTYSPAKALSLGGEEFVRQMKVGCSWGRLRIGMLATLTPQSTNNLIGRMLYMGVCSGTRTPTTSSGMNSFIGVSLMGPAATGSALTYTAGPPPYYTVDTVGAVFRRTNGINTTTATAGAASIWFPDSTGTPSRIGMYIIDINRLSGSPIFASGARCTVSVYHVASTMNATSVFRPDELQEAVDFYGTPTLRGTAMTAWTAVTDLGGTDTLGDLNSISVFYNNATYPLNVYALCSSAMYDTEYCDVGGAYDQFYSPGTHGQLITQVDTGGYWSFPGVFSGTASGTYY